MSDTLYDGRRVPALPIIDEGNREALDIVVAASLPSRRVTQVPAALALVHGAAQAIRADNGPECPAQAFVAHGTAIHHIKRGKPDQNAYIERFSRTHLTEVLNAHLRVPRGAADADRHLAAGLRRGAAARQPRPGAAPHASAEASARR